MKSKWFDPADGAEKKAPAKKEVKPEPNTFSEMTKEAAKDGGGLL